MKCRQENTCGAACQFGDAPRCKDFEPARKFKAFGWDVEVRFHDGHTETFHWRGCTERAAHVKGMMKVLAKEIVKIEPVTEEEWLRAYGMGRM
jgi:hypothetical protein